MRSIRLLGATTVILAGAWACGGDGGGGNNDDPQAAFTPPACTAGAACTFTDASSDPQGVATITTRVWNFGDDTGDLPATGPTLDHTFEAAGTYSVELTVTDNTGLSDVATHQVNVGGVANVPPTAAFTVPACTVNVACLFTDGSTDTDGNITARTWNFGEGAPLTGNETAPSHTYTAEGIYDVTLMVTDNGGATNTTPIQKVTVSGTAAQDCTTTGSSAVCTLAVEQRSTATVTLVSRACELTNNNVFAQQPARRQVINNACVKVAGSTYPIADPTTGTPIIFEAATSLGIELVQGTPDVGDPAVGTPHARMSGSSAAGYVLNMDDGGNPTGPGEPDYDDIVLRVTFTAAP